MEWKQIRRILVGTSGVAFATLVLVVAMVQTKGAQFIRPLSDVSTSTVILVLGAGILPDGRPSDILGDRLRIASQLYERGLGSKVLLTGDGGLYRSPEIAVMKKRALALGIPEEALLIDDRGFRTYESCRRAKETFGMTEVIVITQRFHLGRALYLCSEQGIKVQGVAADLQPYRKVVYFWLRDLLSSAKAWWDTEILAPRSPV